MTSCENTGVIAASRGAAAVSACAGDPHSSTIAATAGTRFSINVRIPRIGLLPFTRFVRSARSHHSPPGATPPPAKPRTAPPWSRGSALIASCMQPAPDIAAYRQHWAARFGTAPFLPMSRAEMDLLGWDSCDVIVVTGDAYVDHPSFGMAIVGRVLEAPGFRVGIIAQPDWRSAEAFRALGRPRLFFGVTAGNMDSMINRYTADRRIRSDEAYTPGGEGGKRA